MDRAGRGPVPAPHAQDEADEPNHDEERQPGPDATESEVEGVGQARARAIQRGLERQRSLETSGEAL